MSGGGATAIRRHPSEATLVAFAAGTLRAAALRVVRGHLHVCPQCRADAHMGEAVGGILLDELPPSPLAPDTSRRVAALLGEKAGGHVQPGAPEATAAETGPQSTLHEFRDVRLRWLAPGVRHAVLLRGPADGTLRLLRVMPGTALPRHAHRGMELTLVLEGAFADEAGHHGPGDLVEVDAEASHQPVAEGPLGCVCLIATEGRLRFGGLIGALFGAVARI